MITETPKVDAADFYMFNSYESGREDYVTIIATYLPLQDPYGGPNYFALDPDALYEIHIDNNGDVQEDLTFQFRFITDSPGATIPVGMGDNEEMVEVPLINVGPITADDQSNLVRREYFDLSLVEGDRRDGTTTTITEAPGMVPSGFLSTKAHLENAFAKPVDNIGMKSIADYAAYSSAHTYEITLPGTSMTGRVFVGQVKDPFVVNLGETFDLINISTGPVGGTTLNEDSLKHKNVTALVLELPKEFLTADAESPIIAGWTTASLPGENEGEWTQVSRLGQPLVNEVVIGLNDKDSFNASEPKDDTQFLTYVTHPTLPELIELLFDVQAPEPPRSDLVSVFLTGVQDLNMDGGTGEVLRLNTSIAAKPAEMQNEYGVIAGDTAGFPNGRRPGDDVVDIALRAVMGVLLPEADAPAGQLEFTDGAPVNPETYPSTFPYLNTALAGSPNDLTPGSTFFDFATEGFNGQGVYTYDAGFGGWLFTSAEIFPNFYSYTRSSWIYWYEGTFGPRWFYDYSTGQPFEIGS